MFSCLACPCTASKQHPFCVNQDHVLVFVSLAWHALLYGGVGFPRYCTAVAFAAGGVRGRGSRFFFEATHGGSQAKLKRDHAKFGSVRYVRHRKRTITVYCCGVGIIVGCVISGCVCVRAEVCTIATT